MKSTPALILGAVAVSALLLTSGSANAHGRRPHASGGRSHASRPSKAGADSLGMMSMNSGMMGSSLGGKREPKDPLASGSTGGRRSRKSASAF